MIVTGFSQFQSGQDGPLKYYEVDQFFLGPNRSPLQPGCSDTRIPAAPSCFSVHFELKDYRLATGWSSRFFCF